MEQVPLPVKTEVEDQDIKPTINTDQPMEEEEEDPAELFYFSSYTSVEALVKNRYDWDKYLVQAGTPGGSSVPAQFVEPPKPQTQSKWKNYLKEPLAVEENPEVVNLIF